jgi:hypothetical protein
MGQKLFLEYGLSKERYKLLKRLNTAKKVQDFLDTLPINHEKEGETYMSVMRTLDAGVAHCLEGALVAALSFWINGQKPLIMDLAAYNGDDHIIALYQVNGLWGAVSKTNHATLRFRDPVYKTPRELAMSYFHEYIHLKTGEKILERFSKPIDLRKITLTDEYEPMTKKQIIQEWVSDKEDLFWLAEAINEMPHEYVYPKTQKKYLRKGDKMELQAGNILEWE